jgi:hypothetical protein
MYLWLYRSDGKVTKHDAEKILYEVPSKPEEERVDVKTKDKDVWLYHSDGTVTKHSAEKIMYDVTSKPEEEWIRGYKNDDIAGLKYVKEGDTYRFHLDNDNTVCVKAERKSPVHHCGACHFDTEHWQVCNVPCRGDDRDDGVSVVYKRVQGRILDVHAQKVVDGLHKKYDGGKLDDGDEAGLHATLKYLGSDLLPMEYGSMREAAEAEAEHGTVFVYEGLRYTAKPYTKCADCAFAHRVCGIHRRYCPIARMEKPKIMFVRY